MELRHFSFRLLREKRATRLTDAKVPPSQFCTEGLWVGCLSSLLELQSTHIWSALSSFSRGMEGEVLCGGTEASGLPTSLVAAS